MQLDQLAELAGVGFFEVDAERNVVALSPEVEEITGFTADEVVGRSCLTLIRCKECLKGCGVFERGRVRNGRVVLYRKDGSEVEVYRSGTVRHDEDGRVVGAVETVRPVAAGAPAGVVPTELDVLLGALGRMFIVADGEFRITAYSPGLPATIGWDEDRLQGLPLEALLGPDLLGAEGELRQALVSGKRREGWRAELPTADGAGLPVSLSIGLIPDDDRCGHVDARIVLMLRPAEEEDASTTQDVPAFHGIVGNSPAMQRIFRMIELLRDHDATVLLTGESGTGKELVARAVHTTSQRANGPFVAVNCAALPAELLESELFGHVRGAFTGAIRDRAGRFELAHGGTLFLDEIGDLAPALQAKLLRVLQERAFERVGDTRTRTVDVRVIAATNRDLPRAVSAQRFREDLYYRLRVIPLEIPPLRQRREDLAPLIRHFLRRIGQRHHRALRLAPTAMRTLLAYPWPGNVRELENALEYATTVCEGQTIHLTDLPAEVAALQPARSVPARATPLAPVDAALADGPAWYLPNGGDATEPASLREPEPAPFGWTLTREEEAEARQIRATLEKTHYKREQAAASLGISRTTLWRKMKQYRL